VPYAIIEMGGRQYRVEKGDSVLVDRIDAEQGAKLTPRAVLFCDGDEALMDGSELGKVKVEAVVAEHLKGDKVRVFKYRPKKRYRRRAGHRSLLTRVEIIDLKLSARAPAKSKSSDKPPKADSQESADK
jgi:large subunit ribosomal protein L21